MKALVLLMALATSLSLFADTFKLATIKNDDPKDHNFYEIYATADSNLIMTAFFQKVFNKNGKLIETKNYDLESMAQGFVLDHRRGQNTITMKNVDFNTAQGGMVEITYLHDGRPGLKKHKSLKMRILPLSDRWVIENQQGKEISQILVKVRQAFIIGVFGIDSIQLK